MILQSRFNIIDLYFDVVAPSLHTALNVETWQHGASSNLGSWCGQGSATDYAVYDINYLNLPYGINFSNYDDHSKFAVATWPVNQPSNPWVCIGDTNRQVSDAKCRIERI